MKLAELRQLYNEYEQTWYARKSIYGEHERAKKLKQYLQKFSKHHNDYELDAQDILQLLQKIPEITHANSNLHLINSIRKKLDQNYLLDIYVVLNNAVLINDVNFAAIYALSAAGRFLVQDLFCGMPTRRIKLNQETLSVVLTLASQFPHCYQAMEQALRFLDKKNNLTPITLHLLKSKMHESPLLTTLLRELDKTNCVNDECLQHFAQRESLYGMDTFIGLLNNTKIFLNEEIVKSICENENLYYLNQIMPILLESAEIHFNITTVSMLLKKEFSFFISNNSILKSLLSNGLLNDKVFDYVCTEDAFSLGQILTILADKSLIQNNQEIIQRIINKEYDGFRFYRAINYLKKADLLDQNSLTFCFQLALKKSQSLLFSIAIFNLFELFQDHQFYMTNEQVKILFSFSDTNLRRVQAVVSKLIRNNILDAHSFEKALQRIASTLPHVTASTLQKTGNKNASTSRSEFLLDNKHSFFTQSKDTHQSGGLGEVKKGYRFLDSDEPIYAVKKLYESDLKKGETEATREVKYHHLLGREAFYFFRKGAAYVVAEWQREKSVEQYEANELLKTSLDQRLRCLYSGLSDLNKLHQHYRVHGDVKCQNFILNLDEESMTLIDFGSSHKRGSSKSFAWTEVYSDPHTFGDHFCKDMYAMGLVTMHLFPELYSITFDQRKANVSLKKTNFTIIEQAIINLVTSMMHADSELRCSSEDALNYCDELINHFYQMDEHLLESITSSCINRSHNTFEDILRM